MYNISRQNKRKIIMKVSVIIPTYNSSEYLDECLESVINQTFDDYEIIIVDNNSQDNTVEKINGYKNKFSNITLIRLDANYKQGIARNIGVQNAIGGYIMFLDSDDKVKNDFIEKMYKKITSDNADITICKWAPFDNKTGKIKYNHGYANFHRLPEKFRNKGFNWRDIKSELFSQSNVPWDKIYKRKFLINKSVEFPGGVFFEDNIFAYEALMKADKVTVLDECLIFYRTNRQQAVTARCDETFFDYLKIFSLMKKSFEKMGLYEEIKYDFLNYKVRSIFWWWKKIKFKYKKQFFEMIKKDFLEMYKTELKSIKDKRNVWTKTLFLTNRVLDNDFKTYMFFLYWDRIFRIEYGIDNHMIMILSNYELWYSNYDGKKLKFGLKNS